MGKETREICQVGRSNQVVEKKAGMLVNSCNSLKSERKMKKGCQVGTGQSWCGEKRRQSLYSIVGQIKYEEDCPVGKRKRRSSGRNKIYRQRRNRDVSQPMQLMGVGLSGRKKIKSTINKERTSVNSQET